MASCKQITNAMIVIALIIGLIAGYANYEGKSTLLFICLGVGLVVLIIAYYFLDALDTVRIKCIFVVYDCVETDDISFL